MNENYEFAFERGQLLKMAGGLASLIVLVFCAGLLAGLALQVSQPAPDLVAQSPKPQPAALQPAPVVLAAPIEQPVAAVADEDLPALEASDDDAAAIDADSPAVEKQVAASSEAEQPVRPGIPGQFAVQLGAFRRADNAGKLAHKMEAKGYEADVVAREDSHGRTWYLVRYGLFPNRAEASAVAIQLRESEHLETMVRPSHSM